MTVREASATFDRHPREVARARKVVAGALTAWGLGVHVPPLELAVSELVTNALVHGQGRIEVSVSAVAGGGVRLEVCDHGGGRPAKRDSPSSDGRVGGWGLQFVEHLADEWGTTLDGERTTVWMVCGGPAPAPGPGAGAR